MKKVTTSLKRIQLTRKCYNLIVFVSSAKHAESRSIVILLLTDKTFHYELLFAIMMIYSDTGLNKTEVI